MKPHSEKFLQQRKFFMVLPLLVLPFVTLLFWALGGGKGMPAEAKETKYSGLNLELPEALFTEEDENWNKFYLYEQADREALKYEQAQKRDPYFEVNPLTTSLNAIETIQNEDKDNNNTSYQSRLNTSLGTKDEQMDPNEAKVNRKLEELYRELDRSTPRPSVTSKEVESNSALADREQSSEIDRLEAMMLMMQEGSTADPEMEQIERVLERILEIRYPDRVKEKIREQSLQHSKQVFPVEKEPGQTDISLLAHTTPYPVNANPIVRTSQNAFYGLEDETFEDQESGNAIEAVIHDTQELMAGSTVKMRLLNDVYVNGRLISKDQFIYGACTINRERLVITIESIRTGNSLFPVSLSVYDLDGLEGIYIPGAITRDVAKQTTDQAIQGLEFYSLDPSVSAQAANAGIQAAKSLLSKKAKAIKVTVKAGYKVLLHGTNT